MLRWRLLLGTIFIAALVALCWLDFRPAGQAGTWLLPLAVVITLAASHELLSLLAARELRPVPWVVFAGNLLIVLSTIFPQLSVEGKPIDWLAVLFALGMILAFAAEMLRYRGPGQVITNVALAVFALAYVGLLMGFVIRLRYVSGGLPLVLLIAVVKIADIGAYTVGRLFGRHKMAPLLSPGKTWEGAAGAMAFSVLAAALVLYVVAPILPGAPTQFPWWWSAVLGVSIGIAGMLGDLAESLLKRDMGRKDSSNWMPGFGGVLDIMDSILLAAPVAYLAWIALLATA